MVNLKQTIINNMKNIEMYQMNMRILDYYLNKNLTTIFGKTIFEENEIDIMKINESDKDLEVNVGGEEYQITMDNVEAITLKSVKSPVAFKITSKNGIMSNFLVNCNNNEMVTEKQNVNMGEDEYYEYKKIITLEDGMTKEYPYYRLTDLHVRNGKIENYALSMPEQKPATPNHSFLKRLYDRLKEANKSVVEIKTDIEDLTSFKNIEEIFAYLEAKTKEEELVRK